MDLAGHGALLVRCKQQAATAPPIAVSPTQQAVSASKPDSISAALSGSSGASTKLLGAYRAVDDVLQVLRVVFVSALPAL